MCTRVLQADIAPVIQTICGELTSLKEKIGDDVCNVNNEEVARLVGELHKTINQFSREVNQSVSIAPLADGIKTSLFKLISGIQHTPAFSQAIGAQQDEILKLFKRIELGMTKAESRVQKVDNDPISR